MKVLVINCGSSSIKYKLYEMSNKSVLAAGGIEKIGLEGSFLKTKINGETKIIESACPTHTEGIKLMFDTCSTLSMAPSRASTKFRLQATASWQADASRRARLLRQKCFRNGSSIWTSHRSTARHT